jgi:hypothetical protein
MESYEGSDSVCRVVHLVRALLACGNARTDSLSGCLAFVPAIAPYRHHGRGGLRVGSRSAISSSSSSWMEKTRVSYSMKAPPKPVATVAGRQPGPGGGGCTQHSAALSVTM